MPPLPDIAIVLTAHHEGRGLVPTVRALDRAVAEAASLAVEVIVVRDRTDRATEDALRVLVATSGFAHAASIVMLDVDNGDLSASRNDGIARTTAPYVGVLDADNLPSANWITAAYAALIASEEPAVVHPELIVTFGSKREVWPLLASTDPAFHASWLSWFNPWDAFSMADRTVFERFPYPPSPPGGGFGPEDWAWNCDTVAAGVPHIVAPDTTLYYRSTDHGLAAAHGASLLPRNELLRDADLAADTLRRLTVREEPAPRAPSQAARFVRGAARRALRTARRVIAPVRAKLGRSSRPGAIAERLYRRRDDWAALHLLQPALPFPHDDVLRGYGEWGTRWDEIFLPEQRAYWAGVATLPAVIDVLVVAPWLRTGGADLLTMQYIQSVRRSRPDAVIALVTTEPESSTRLDDLDGVTVFELGVHRLLPQFGVRVLGTLIAQLRPGAVHVVNSTLGFDVIDLYGRPLSAHSHLFASTFVVDVLPDGTDWSFLHHRSRDFYESLTAVLTDNKQLVTRMIEQEGAPADVFVVHHAAVDEEFAGRGHGPRTFTASAPLRVVWAGRFDRQKRLDRLARIVESMEDSPVEFHVFGDSVIGDDTNLPETLGRLERAGVVRHDAYSRGFAEVVNTGADVLLMTSDREGLPNTVLEAMSSGLSVVAPDVGDVGRVISSDTGYLVTDPDDISAYVAALESIIDEQDSAVSRIEAARALVEREYSSAALDATLEVLPGYLPRRQGQPGTAYRWFTDPSTAELLRSETPLTLVYTGSNGHSNFGDILQNKNILHYWSHRPDRTPVLFLPSFAAESSERVASLRTWFGCPNIVFFSPRRSAVPSGMIPVPPVATGSPVHVVGGGYLNAMWGADHFAAIDAIATAFDASEVLFTGLQVDERALSGFSDLQRRHSVPFIGLRDRSSLALVEARGEIPAIDTFDDLTEVLEDWSRDFTGPPSSDGGLRVAIHMNTSDYAGGAKALEVWKDALHRVAALEPSEVILLSAYSDARPEVRDTIGSVKALAEDFPFASVTLLDTARAALDSTAGTGLPPSLDAMRGVHIGLSSSYHTALMMSFFGIPTYLMGVNSYFSQKAELFDLPDLGTFLAEPENHRLDVTGFRTRRRSWIEQLDAREFGRRR